ncbi:MAG: hypothetical protein IJD85_02075 [Oscillospiraceae bacterium]|nr:hypothetical protein [Oscillospiraceae bacterium]
MWKLTTEEMTSEDGAVYTAYGFSRGECHVKDFTSLQAEAEIFLDILNANDVSPVHVYEVIEDYFAAI